VSNAKGGNEVAETKVTVSMERLMEWLDEQEGGELYPRLTEESKVSIAFGHGAWVTFEIDNEEE
jgi:hypothetical protein